MEDRAYEYWFYSLEYITDTEREYLLKTCGNLREIFGMPRHTLECMEHISERAKMSILYRRDEKIIARELREL